MINELCAIWIAAFGSEPLQEAHSITDPFSGGIYYSYIVTTTRESGTFTMKDNVITLSPETDRWMTIYGSSEEDVKNRTKALLELHEKCRSGKRTSIVPIFKWEDEQ